MEKKIAKTKRVKDGFLGEVTQHPRGKNLKGQIGVPSANKTGTAFPSENCMSGGVKA